MVVLVVLCGEVAAAKPKDHMWSCRTWAPSARCRELDPLLKWCVFAQQFLAAGLSLSACQSGVCWNAWKLNCAAQWKAECGCTSFLCRRQLGCRPPLSYAEADKRSGCGWDERCRLLVSLHPSIHPARLCPPELTRGGKRGYSSLAVCVRLVCCEPGVIEWIVLESCCVFWEGGSFKSFQTPL